MQVCSKGVKLALISIGQVFYWSQLWPLRVAAFFCLSFFPFFFCSFYNYKVKQRTGTNGRLPTRDIDSVHKSFATKHLGPLDLGWPELRAPQGYSAILFFALHWIQTVFTLMLPLGPHLDEKSASLGWWNAILRLYSNNNTCLFQICVIV